ncbi:MAG: glutamate 5-kinase [bacterium]|nr:glutamate 5-kinase [bacterium]
MRSRGVLRKARRVVIKVGTSVVSKRNGDVDVGWARSFAEQVGELRRQGREVIVVSSGAIGAGRHVLQLAERPKTLVEKQAAAAVGQPRLMRVFKDAFRRVGLVVAQILLTYDDLDSKLRCRNAVNTINLLLKMGVVPIINENDTVAVEEIKFGDNDYLSALTFEIMGADALILLTDVDGVLAAGDGRNGEARVIASVSRATWAEVELGITTATSAGGTGGMKSKVEAARAAVEHGGVAVIARGKTARVLERIFAGEEIGTFFG